MEFTTHKSVGVGAECRQQGTQYTRVIRGDRIRTCDLVVPNHALYQAELRPGV